MTPLLQGLKKTEGPRLVSLSPPAAMPGRGRAVDGCCGSFGEGEVGCGRGRRGAACLPR
jgi:hypothetical protein